MPEFAPGESKTAVAPITVAPAGLSCSAEVFLGPDEMTKVATSGKMAFSSTGAEQSISLPITLPGVEGTYPVYLDIFIEGQLIAEFRGDDDVVIVSPLVTLGWSKWTNPYANPSWYRSLGLTDWSGLYRISTVISTDYPLMGLLELAAVGIDVSDCSPGYWTPPYTAQLAAVGRTSTVWANPVKYIRYTITGIYPQEASWRVERQQVFLGLNNIEVIDYWKSVIPLDTPLYLYFSPSVEDTMLTELESTGAADVIENLVVPGAEGHCYVVIRNLDQFFTVIQKYDWIVSAGAIIQ